MKYGWLLSYSLLTQECPNEERDLSSLHKDLITNSESPSRIMGNSLSRIVFKFASPCSTKIYSYIGLTSSSINLLHHLTWNANQELFNLFSWCIICSLSLQNMDFFLSILYDNGNCDTIQTKLRHISLERLN